MRQQGQEHASGHEKRTRGIREEHEAFMSIARVSGEGAVAVVLKPRFQSRRTHPIYGPLRECIHHGAGLDLVGGQAFPAGSHPCHKHAIPIVANLGMGGGRCSGL